MTDISADPAAAGGACQRRNYQQLVRPSLLWCFRPATGSLDPSCARRKPATIWKLAVVRAGRQVKARFEASFKAVQKATFGSMGCRPRAGSVLHCHGVWALRHGPWTRADGRKKQGLKLVSRQFRKQRLAVWAAWCLSPATRSLHPSWRQEKARFEAIVSRQLSVLHCHGVWNLWHGPWTRADGRKKQGLKLVSREFRKQRLAVWASGRRPDPSFTAMVFERVGLVSGNGSRRTDVGVGERQCWFRGVWALRHGPWTRADGRKKQGYSF